MFVCVYVRVRVCIESISSPTVGPAQLLVDILNDRFMGISCGNSARLLPMPCSAWRVARNDRHRAQSAGKSARFLHGGGGRRLFCSPRKVHIIHIYDVQSWGGVGQSF